MQEDEEIKKGEKKVEKKVEKKGEKKVTIYHGINYCFRYPGIYHDSTGNKFNIITMRTAQNIKLMKTLWYVNPNGEELLKGDCDASLDTKKIFVRQFGTLANKIFGCLLFNSGALVAMYLSNCLCMSFEKFAEEYI